MATAIGAGLFALVSFLYYWDPTRLAWKRWIESDPYRYETIHPQHRAINFADRVGIHQPADVEAMRSVLRDAIWPEGMPASTAPTRVVRDVPSQRPAGCPRGNPDRELFQTLPCAMRLYGGIDGVAGVDWLWFTVGRGYVARAAHLRPIRPNGRAVIYHHGFAGTYHDQHRHLTHLAASGYHVFAHNLPHYGGNLDGLVWRGQPLTQGADSLRYFVEPTIATVTYAHEALGVRSVDMIGLSAGAFVTVVAAAVDPRIRRSYPVAGTLPLSVRAVRNETANPQLHPLFADRVTYLDLYVLGAVGAGRGQLQVFNQFDRCCFANRRGELYEATVANAVSRAGGGRFRVTIDESHARHKISSRALALILDDVAKE